MVTITLRGVERVQQRLQKYLVSKGKTTQDALSMVAFATEAEVKLSISGRIAEPRSVDTGRFLNSVQTRISPGVSTVSSTVTYGPILEYGSSTRVPRRHFRNSAARMRSRINELVKKSF